MNPPAGSGWRPRQQAFLVIGAMKSGTTTIAALLERHPEVDLPIAKETAAFLTPEGAEWGAARMHASHASAVGEVSTGYMQQPIHRPRPDLVRRALGEEVRLIAVLRDPFDRAVSHWRHWAQLGRTGDAPLTVAILDPGSSYVAFSSYCRQLQPWIEEFGAERVHPIRLEDYQSAPAATLRVIWDALGVAPRGVYDEVIVQENAGDVRVVARGMAGRLRRSVAYRKALRPLLPARARRVGAMGLGGAAGRTLAPGPTTELRDAFLGLLSEDLSGLARTFPHLIWPGPREKEE